MTKKLNYVQELGDENTWNITNWITRVKNYCDRYIQNTWYKILYIFK
jgi:hypothetical protein